MNVLGINTDGVKPRKGVMIFSSGNNEGTELSLPLPAAAFIASFRLKPLGYVMLGIFQADEQGILIELRVDEQEVQPGYIDRNTRLNILTTGGSDILLSYLSRLNTKDLTVAYTPATEILTVYYFGQTVELQLSDFNPTHVDITVELPYQLEAYGLFTHYDTNAPEFDDVPDIPLTWRKWYKDQLELTTGYRNFADALKAYNTGNSLLGDAEFWDQIGLHVDEPVPEDFIPISRNVTVMPFSLTLPGTPLFGMQIESVDFRTSKP